MKNEDKIEISFEQLEEFYKLAYEDGRLAKMVCGGLSKIKEHTDVKIPTIKSLYLSYYQER